MPFERKYKIVNVGVKKAIDFYGSKKIMAKALGVNTSAINRWLIGERIMLPRTALKISSITKIPFEELYPKESDLKKYIKNKQKINKK